MKPLFIPVVLLLALTPAGAQQADDKGLVERGLEMFLRGLMDDLRPQLDELSQSMQDAARQMGPALEQLRALIDDMGNYEPPERLPNGDILIRRKPEAPQPEPQGPQIEL